MFMALFTIGAHLMGYRAPPDTAHVPLPVSFPPIAFGCTLIASYYEQWFVLTAEQVCWELLLLRTKMTQGVK